MVTFDGETASRVDLGQPNDSVFPPVYFGWKADIRVGRPIPGIGTARAYWIRIDCNAPRSQHIA